MSNPHPSGNKYEMYLHSSLCTQSPIFSPPKSRNDESALKVDYPKYDSVAFISLSAQFTVDYIIMIADDKEFVKNMVIEQNVLCY